MSHAHEILHRPSFLTTTEKNLAVVRKNRITDHFGAVTEMMPSRLTVAAVVGMALTMLYMPYVEAGARYTGNVELLATAIASTPALRVERVVYDHSAPLPKRKPQVAALYEAGLL